MFSIRYRDTDQTWSICPDVCTNHVSSPQPLCGTIAQEELAAVETYKATDRAREGQWKTNDLTKNGCFTSKNGDGFRFKAYNFVVDEHPNGGINIHEQQILPGCKQDYIDYMHCCGLFMWISKSLPFPWSAIGNPRLPAKNFWRWPIRIEWLLWSVWSSSYGMNIKYDHQ